jgi:hypothetical protein
VNRPRCRMTGLGKSIVEVVDDRSKRGREKER